MTHSTLVETCGYTADGYLATVKISDTDGYGVTQPAHLQSLGVGAGTVGAGGTAASDLGTLTGRYKKNRRYRPVVKCDRVLKSYVHAAAKHSPGKWVSEIDPRGEDSFPNIPEEFICGWWLIGKDGIITRNFRQNSLFKENVESESDNKIRS